MCGMLAWASTCHPQTRLPGVAPRCLRSSDFSRHCHNHKPTPTRIHLHGALRTGSHARCAMAGMAVIEASRSCRRRISRGGHARGSRLLPSIGLTWRADVLANMRRFPDRRRRVAASFALAVLLPAMARHVAGAISFAGEVIQLTKGIPYFGPVCAWSSTLGRTPRCPTAAFLRLGVDRSSQRCWSRAARRYRLSPAPTCPTCISCVAAALSPGGCSSTRPAASWPGCPWPLVTFPT